MHTIFDVAQWFLAKESMAQKKLQILCYYAQAWYFTLCHNGPLFQNKFQAWVYGPTCPELHERYSSYAFFIPIPQCADNGASFSEKELDMLEAVWNTYGPLSEDELEMLVHREDPWIAARGDAKPWKTCKNVISLESMKEYYWWMWARANLDVCGI